MKNTQADARRSDRTYGQYTHKHTGVRRTLMYKERSQKSQKEQKQTRTDDKQHACEMYSFRGHIDTDKKKYKANTNLVKREGRRKLELETKVDTRGTAIHDRLADAGVKAMRAAVQHR